MASKRPTNVKRRSTKSGTAKPPTVKEPKAKAPTLPEVVAGHEGRLASIEHRLGIDHAAIAADALASSEAGAAAAALSESPVEVEAE